MTRKLMYSFMVSRPYPFLDIGSNRINTPKLLRDQFLHRSLPRNFRHVFDDEIEQLHRKPMSFEFLQRVLAHFAFFPAPAPPCPLPPAPSPLSTNFPHFNMLAPK